MLIKNYKKANASKPECIAMVFRRFGDFRFHTSTQPFCLIIFFKIGLHFGTLQFDITSQATVIAQNC